MSRPDGLILTGGAGRRLGLGPKQQVRIGNRSLLEHALGWFGPQVASVMTSTPETVPGWPLMVAADRLGRGPLAGMHAALRESPADWLAVIPVDAVSGPTTLVDELIDAAGDTGAAHVDDRYCCLVMNRRLLPPLETHLQAGHRRVRDWLAACGSCAIPADGNAVWSVNDADELRAAERRIMAA